MRKNQKKIINLILVAVLIGIVVASLFFIVAKKSKEVQTSLVRKYWGGSTQCIAYVQRYYKNVYNIEINDVGRAQDLYLKAPEYGLYAHRNGGITAPQPGHILVFEHRNRIGHVAIITGRLKNGILIAEQNWGSARITTNESKSLPMDTRNGQYFVHDRDGYKILGWVGLMLENPTRTFDFTNKSSEGWITENNTSVTMSDNDSLLAVEITGNNPSIISPVFIEPIDVQNHPWLIFKARSYDFILEDPKQGAIHLRDENDQWGTVIPFKVKARKAETSVIYSVDLSNLRKDFSITQVRIELPGYNRKSGNMWEFDWLEISRVKIEN
ncbi:MAG: CHAP domain-containing protein [Patescibacteria group bacterium]|nr:CHAP domain-containing protein [Patescibacteria group bacterium]